MIGQLLNENTIQNWTYLNIDEKVLRDRYDQIKISFPIVDLNYPWAIRNDIERLFHLCISFDSKNEVLNWMKTNLVDINLNGTHLSLIDLFSYLKAKNNDDLDSLIEKSDDFSLLNFIHLTLDSHYQQYPIILIK